MSALLVEGEQSGDMSRTTESIPSNQNDRPPVPAAEAGEANDQVNGLSTSLVSEDKGGDPNGFAIKAARCDKCESLVNTPPVVPGSVVSGVEGEEEGFASKANDAALEDDDKKEEDLKPPPEGNFIRYKNVYTNTGYNDDVLYTATAYEPIEDEESEEVEEQRRAVFDVVTTFSSLRYFESSNRPIFKKPPRSRDDATESIIIRSSAIMHTIRSVVRYYPDLDLSGETLTLNAPYRALVFHYDELSEYREECKPGEDGQHSYEDDKDIYEHLGLLLEFLDEKVMHNVIAERQRHENGLCTFQWLWIMFKPGTDVAANNGTPKLRGGMVGRDGAVVASVKGGPTSAYYKASAREERQQGRKIQLVDSSGTVLETFQGGQRIPAWQFKVWSMQFDGKWLGRKSREVTIGVFDGEMEIGRLEILPVGRCKDAADGKSLFDYLISQGKKYFALLKPMCMHHGGEVMQFPMHEVEGQVMVDTPAFFEDFPDKREMLDSMSGDPNDPSYIPGCQCSTCQKKRNETGAAEPGAVKFTNYDELRPENVDSLTEHQYFLCPQVVYAWFFKNRSWIIVDVRNLSKPEWNTSMINTLVLKDKPIQLLKALSQGFMLDQAKDAHWTADFVKGKGNAQIFLLHGQPGVGKTYTAECIAEYTKRPLMTLTCSDIGTEAVEIERNLERSFKTAKKWGAILLIDEADIYLERREKSDLTRNSLVAGFLRALEVYEGILFLTTNRVGTFDDAFISRIHVKLYYPPLEKEDRQRIWGNFIKKLKDERGDTMKITEDAEDYLESRKFLDYPFNGREIRNIFQTAVGLAEYQGDRDKRGKIQLMKEHITQVVEMSGEFKTYLNKVWALDEAQRAHRAYLRADADGQEDGEENGK